MEIAYDDYNDIDGLGISFKSAFGFVKRNIQSANRDTGKFIKKHATLNNLITAVSIAAMVIPGGQAVAIGTKIAKLGMLAKAAKLAAGAKKLIDSPIGQAVIAKIGNKQPLTADDAAFIDKVAVAQDVDPNTPNMLGAAEFAALTNASQKQADQPQVQLPQVVKTALASANPNISDSNVVDKSAVSNTSIKTKQPMSTQNIMLIGGGVVAAGVITYLVIKK